MQLLRVAQHVLEAADAFIERNFLGSWISTHTSPPETAVGISCKIRCWIERQTSDGDSAR